MNKSKQSTTTDSNDELREKIIILTTQQRTVKVLTDGAEIVSITATSPEKIDAIINLIQQEQAKLLKRIEDEVIGDNEPISNKLHGGSKPNYTFIMNRNKLRAKQRKALNAIKDIG